MKRAVLELGGSNPFLVLPDADLPRAVAAVVVPGRFGNAGQACTSSKRLIVHTDVWHEFLESFLSSAAQWRLGDPMKADTRLGPMATVAGRNEFAEQVDDAVAKGAVVLQLPADGRAAGDTVTVGQRPRRADIRVGYGTLTDVSNSASQTLTTKS